MIKKIIIFNILFFVFFLYADTEEISLDDFDTPSITNIYFIDGQKIVIIRKDFVSKVYFFDKKIFDLKEEYTDYVVDILTNLSGKDITGNNIADLVIETYSGGAHCCYNYLIYEKGEDNFFYLIQELFDDDVLQHSTARFTNLDKENDLEIIINDWTFAYWKTCFAESPAPEVILKFDKLKYKYSVCPELMKKPVLSEEKLYKKIIKVKEEFEELKNDKSNLVDSLFSLFFNNDNEMTSPELLRTMLDLIYTGNMNEAGRFFKLAWPGTKDEAKKFLVSFQDQLETSPWWQYIKELNKDQDLFYYFYKK